MQRFPSLGKFLNKTFGYTNIGNYARAKVFAKHINKVDLASMTNILDLGCGYGENALMMAKAFYIVAYFMHLKHELKNLIMTIVVPLALFIWFIAAFLSDGNSFRNLRNTYNPYFKAQSTIKVEPKEEGAHANGAKEGTSTEAKGASKEEKKEGEHK
jgi:hypothetical protein